MNKNPKFSMNDLFAIKTIRILQQDMNKELTLSSDNTIADAIWWASVRVYSPNATTQLLCITGGVKDEISS